MIFVLTFIIHTLISLMLCMCWADSITETRCHPGWLWENNGWVDQA